MSSFAWLDTSERDRRRTLDILDLFQQKETVDELGIGSVRDAIAEALSPGTSTIQTRARYFFFVPWVYIDLERKSDLRDIAERARRAEAALMRPLLDSEDSDGAIGKLAGAAVKRLPSSVYWAGLGRLGFRLFAGSRDQYHRALQRGQRGAQLDDARDLALDGPLQGHWYPPRGFPNEASFALTRAESDFFRERLDLRARGSLLHFLVRREEPVELVDMA